MVRVTNLDSIPLLLHVMVDGFKSLLRISTKTMLLVSYLPEEVHNVMLNNMDLGGDGHVVQAPVDLAELLDHVLKTFLQLLPKAGILHLAEAPERLKQRQPLYLELIRFLHDNFLQHRELLEKHQPFQQDTLPSSDLQ